METEVITDPAAAGDTGVETPSSTATPPAAQAPAEPQTADPSVVDTRSKEPQAPVAPRGMQPSDHFRERNRIRKLEETIANLNKKLEDSLKPKTAAADEVPDFDPAHFSPEHKRILAAREQALQRRLDAMEEKFQSALAQREEREVERRNQEVLEKLFPKSSPESRETLEERINKDPERAMRIKEFLLDSGLNEFFNVNPQLAEEILLAKLGEQPKATNPKVLPKSLMGASNSSSGNGSRQGRTEQDLASELRKLNEQLAENQSLRDDPKFMEQRAKLLSDLTTLVRKK